MLKVSIFIINIMDKDYKIEKLTDNNYIIWKFKIKAVLENKNLETGIQDFVDTWDIGMVAIGAKNLNFIQRLMLRPTSEVNNYHTDIPFLVLHE